MKKLLITLLVVFYTTASFAVNVPFSMHFEDEMRHPDRGKIRKMYGYIDVEIGKKNVVLISFKASNGRQLDGSKFNAKVIFISTSGRIKSKVLSHKIGAAGFNGSVERMSSIKIQLTDKQVRSLIEIKVDFYLTDPDNFSIGSSIAIEPNSVGPIF